MELLGDATLQIGLTLLVPFASYVLAEEFHGSGVLAVLTTALFLAEYATDADDVLARLAGHTFWEIVDTLVTGRRLRADRAGAAQRHSARRPGGGARCSAGRRPSWGSSSVVRLLWLLPATWLAKRLHARRDYDEEIPMSWRETVVMWWSGMRGVASVALALAIPLETDDGGRRSPTGTRSSSSRSAVIMATLVLQGLTLPWLVRRLGVQADTDRGEGVREGAGAPGGEGGEAAAAGRSRRSRSCRRSCPSRCCGGPTTSGPGSARTSWRTSGGRRYEQRVQRLKQVRRIQGEML